MNHLKSFRKSSKLNQDGFSHHLLFVLLIVVIIGGIGAYVLANSRAATVTNFKGHCKDSTHLFEVPVEAGKPLTQASDIEIKVLQATDTLQCINGPAVNYRGPIYTFFYKGNEELHMLPARAGIDSVGGAEEIQAALADAGAQGKTIEVEHSDNGSPIFYRAFTAEAATKISDELAQLLNGTGGNVTYFKGHCLNYVPGDASNSDLKVQTAASNATLFSASSVSIKKNTATNTLRCINNPSYRGSIYTFVVNGKEQLDMLPGGANYVKNQFQRYANGTNSGNPDLWHKVNGTYLDYKSFAPDATQKVVTQLSGYGI